MARTADGALVYTGYPQAPYGTIAERMAVPAGMRLPLPEGADPAQVAAGLNPGMASWLPLQSRQREAGSLGTVAVLGATGMAGMLAVQNARLLGATRVIGAGRNQAGLDDQRVGAAVQPLGAAAGAVPVALSGEQAADAAALAAALDGSAPGLVLDFVWAAPAEAMFAALGRRGLHEDGADIAYVQIGALAGPQAAVPAALLRSRRIRISGSGAESVPAATYLAELPAYMRLIAESRVQVPTRTFPLSRITEAWTAARDGGPRGGYRARVNRAAAGSVASGMRLAAGVTAAVMLLTGTVTQAQPQAGARLRVVASPSVPKSDYDELDAVAAASPASAWAVGFARRSRASCCAPFRALIEHWDGSAWSIGAAAPEPAGDDTRLHAVTALAADNAWAVGSLATTAGASGSLIEHWDGTSWAVVRSPADEPPDAVLDAVSAVSPADIWAAGYSASAAGFSPLTEHWDGTAWSVVPGAAQPAGRDFLRGIAAISATDVWAVGDDSPHNGVADPVIEHWNGTSWANVSQQAGTFSILSAVSAAGARNVWAAGSSTGQPGGALIEHFNGTAWAVVPASGASGDLSGVAALSSTDAWAAGISTGGQALAMHWDGTAWQTVPAANPGSDSFSSVGGTRPGQPLWAAGNVSQAATLIETTTG